MTRPGEAKGSSIKYVRTFVAIFDTPMSALVLRYESPILSQLLDPTSPPKINTFESRFVSNDPWEMTNGPVTVL